ncbi:cysteine-rich receptor-like protein kinase 3 [Arachis duranensis]|uniref:Cysteine-rich receptor-like protein kinase 3 n=1 Tax=Arachis duranensis TaxID=130453 RepID=A0A6P4DIA6_ARADU|nr:cysteine-rich receptor-like protein kinase 3 [Arachis duranensis]
MPSSSSSSFLIVLLCCYHALITIIPCALGDPRTTEAALLCSNIIISPPVRRDFISNFWDALSSMTPLVSNKKFAALHKGSQNATVYAFSECMKDLSKPDCDVCFSESKTKILRCSPFQRGTIGGRLFLDGCYMRYDHKNFFNDSSVSGEDKTVCGTKDFGGDRSVYKANAMELVRNLSLEAQKKNNVWFFHAGSVNHRNVSVYGLAQCWKFVNESGCKTCLDEAVTRIESCASKEEGRVLSVGCYLRYSNDKFYNDNSSNVVVPFGKQGHSNLPLIVAASSSSLALLLIVVTVTFFVRMNILKQRRERRKFGALLETVNQSKLNMSYEVLEQATNYFNDSNKLGEGGTGSVYKGVLPDGKIVAIKRLSFITTQWADHFFNEVNLISGIQHKNLVKLLGCSITGPESLLVYEYVPNGSLSDHFCVRKKSEGLNWEVRHKILLGTAEGLAYLHEESQMRIIHRDIKLGNVLLDENFTPKIADFGLVRLFPEDNSHLSTTIAGTLGYMAPEYVILGKLTEKADVYSFGVLAIEIVSGKKIRSIVQNSISLLHEVWSLYETKKLCEIVDLSLEGNYPAEEACKLLKIGLLCAQASPELRPSMSQVVKMIKDNNQEQISEPTQPPFLNRCSGEFSRSILDAEDSFNAGSYAHHHSSVYNTSENLIQPLYISNRSSEYFSA